MLIFVNFCLYQEVASPTKRGRGLGEVEGEPDLEPLPEGTLARNLGLELLVVVTKTDYMMELEKDFDYKDEHFDFIQQAVRFFKFIFNNNNIKQL